MVEILFEESNFAVVRLPKRKFPGIVIQGDTLAILYAQADELRASVESVETKELADELVELIKIRLLTYEEVLKQNGIPVPYSGRE